MNNALVSFLLGIGFAGWVYAKIYRSTGGNTKSALVVAGASGFVAFILMMIILGFIPSN